MAPINDDFINAELMVGDNGSTSGTTVGATLEAGEPDDFHGLGNTVWYKWIPTVNGTGSITMDPFSTWMRLDIFVGTNLLDIVDIAGQVTYTPFPIVTRFNGGKEYWIRIYNDADIPGPEGPFDLSWSLVPCIPPSNDDFTNLQLIMGASGSIMGSNDCATLEMDEPPVLVGTGTSTVWYSWTAPTNGTATFTVSTEDFTPETDIYTGADLGSLSLFASGANSIVHAVSRGTTYYIRINGSEYSDFGSFELLWDLALVPISPPAVKRTLGCSQHTAYIQDKCGGPRLCELSNMVDLQYDRRLDDISEATITIPISGDSDDPCCACLKDVEPWCHVLTIVREGDGVVWTGPITKITYGYNTVKILARDNLAWLQKRVNAIDVIVAYPNTTICVTTLAKMVIETAMADDDSPCLLNCVLDMGDGYPLGADRSVGNGLPSTARPTVVGFPAFGGPTAYDDLTTLGNSGIDFTAVNQCILLTGEKLPEIGIGILTDELLLGEIEISKDGNLLANRVYARYTNDDDCVGFCTEPGSPCPCPGEAHAPNQYCYGLLELVVPDAGGGAVNLDSARVLANTYLNASKIVPRVVEFSGETKLSPNCPWTFNEMIPGQRLDLALSKLCLPVFQGFKIQQVTVTDGADGESISLGLTTQATS